MNKWLVLAFMVMAPNAGAEVKTLLSCGDYEVKVQPTGTRMANHFIAGMDVNNAIVWVEQSGKKLSTKVEQHSEGGNFLATNSTGEAVKITSTGPNTYGIQLQGKPAGECKLGSSKTAAKGVVKTLFDCGTYNVKVQPTGTRMANHFIAGMDVNNAVTWIEEDGKKLKTKVKKHSEGGDFTATNAKGEIVKVTSTSFSTYGVIINGKPAGECKTTADPKAPNGPKAPKAAAPGEVPAGR